MDISSEHLHAQTVRAREVKFLEKVHLLQPIMCHMSHVMCHVSHVTGQSGETSRWMVCYQWGYPV